MRIEHRALVIVLVLMLVALVSRTVIAGTTPAPLSLSHTLRTSGDAYGIAIDGANGRAYVPDSRENTVYVFDLATGDVVSYIPTGEQPSHAALVGPRLYVSNFGDATISVIDVTSAKVSHTLAVGGLGLALDATTGRLYAAAGPRVVVLDALTTQVITTMAVPGGGNAWGVAVDPATHRVYVTDIASPRVLVYDGASGTLAGEIALDAPARFAISVSAGRVYVASFTDNDPQLSVIDSASSRVITRVPVAAFARSLVVDSTSGLVYATGGADRSVRAIDVQKRSVVAQTTLVESAGAVALHPVSGEPIVTTQGGRPPRSLGPLPEVRQ